MKIYFKYIVLTALALLQRDIFAQSAASNPNPAPQDSVIIFESPRPLIDASRNDLYSRPNTWGFSGSITDYGFGLGLFYRYAINPIVNVGVNLDMGGAKANKEYGLTNEIKMNRIYVMPLLANVQYRLFTKVLSESFRPYITAGAGPVFVMTTDGQKEYFAALASPTFNMTYGFSFGFGSNFGFDPKTTLGVNLRYFYIPYSKGVVSVQGTTLTDFNAVALTVTYGFNW